MRADRLRFVPLATGEAEAPDADTARDGEAGQ